MALVFEGERGPLGLQGVFPPYGTFLYRVVRDVSWTSQGNRDKLGSTHPHQGIIGAARFWHAMARLSKDTKVMQ